MNYDGIMMSCDDWWFLWKREMWGSVPGCGSGLGAEDQASRLSQAADEADRRARDPDDMARQERGFR